MSRFKKVAFVNGVQNGLHSTKSDMGLGRIAKESTILQVAVEEIVILEFEKDGRVRGGKHENIVNLECWGKC